MTYLFSRQGLSRLKTLCLSGRALYAFDYDGTLSAIVAHPADAHLDKTIATQLKSLCHQGTVALVSGRAKDDLALRVPSEIPYLIGNHGIESSATTDELEKKCKLLTEVWATHFQNLQNKINDEGAIGFECENKGFSFTLHYRNCADPKRAKQVLLKYIYQLDPVPRVIDGKAVLNLVPQGSPHKGVALLNLLRKLQINHALYIGDDETDEDVFDLRDERILSIRIGKKKASHAQFYLKSQSEIGLLLGRLIEMTAMATKIEASGHAKKSVGL